MSEPYPTSIKLPTELREQIDAIAEAERRKRQPMLIILLEEAVGARARRKRR